MGFIDNRILKNFSYKHYKSCYVCNRDITKGYQTEPLNENI